MGASTNGTAPPAISAEKIGKGGKRKAGDTGVQRNGGGGGGSGASAPRRKRWRPEELDPMIAAEDAELKVCALLVCLLSSGSWSLLSLSGCDLGLISCRTAVPEHFHHFLCLVSIRVDAYACFYCCTSQTPAMYYRILLFTVLSCPLLKTFSVVWIHALPACLPGRSVTLLSLSGSASSASWASQALTPRRSEPSWRGKSRSRMGWATSSGLSCPAWTASLMYVNV